MTKLLNLFKSFKNNESGAVTVDWVVLTGAVVALGVLVVGPLSTGITTTVTGIATELGQ